MSRTAVPLALVCTLLFGCGTNPKNPPNVGGPTSLHTWSDDGESGAGTVFHVGTLFVIWTDFPNGGGGNDSSNMHGVTFRGRLITSDQGQVNFSGESADGRSGKAVIDGNSYDLENGNLFLVTPGDNGYSIKQLKRDLGNRKFELTALQNFAKADTEIKEFFAGDRAEQESP